jgi:general secretion pathway protein N
MITTLSCHYYAKQLNKKSRNLMKKWFVFGAVFLSSYLVFLVASAPLLLLTNNVKLPKNVEISGVSGSIWQGEIAKVTINNIDIKDVNSALSFWSLIRLSPAVEVSFGDAISSGPEGKFTLTVSPDALILSKASLFMAANQVASQLPLPIPVNAMGNVELNVAELSVNTDNGLTCRQASGRLIWLRSSVVALDNTIKLGNIGADLSCDKDDFLAKVNPNNNLGLSFTARLLMPSQRVTGQGFIKPGSKFPEALKPAMTFIGRADQQGRYQLKF